MKKLAAVVVALLAAGLVTAAVFARVAIVTTFGNSMEPGFHAGDLALLVPAADYGVGDVVGYHSDDLDTVVMHRIVDVDGDGYVLQGDNNDWLDPEHPNRDQLVGKLALRVPQGGMWLQRLSSPTALAVIAFGLLAGGGAAVETRRRRRGPVAAPEDQPSRRRGTRPERTSTTRPADPVTVGVAVAAGVALLAGALLGLVTFADPARTTTDVPYFHQGSFGYSAAAPRGPVYPEGVVETGDTVFLQVVDDIEATFDWRLDPPPGRGNEVDVTGTGQLLLEVSDGSGWRRTIPLADPEEISGSEATLGATVDLASIQRLVASVQRATGATGTSQSLTLVADLRLEGTVAGQAVTDELRPTVTFTLDPLRLQPPTAEAGSDALAVDATRTITIPAEGAATLDLLGRSLGLGLTRTIAGGLLIVGVLLVAAWALLRRRELAQTAEEHIASRYGGVLIEASGVAPAAGRTRVQVTSIRDLVRLADKLVQPVLRVPTTDGATTYLVDDGYTLYQHRPDADARIARPPAVDA